MKAPHTTRQARPDRGITFWRAAVASLAWILRPTGNRTSSLTCQRMSLRIQRTSST